MSKTNEIKGIGIDSVYIPRINELLTNNNKSFFTHTYTEYENKQAEKFKKPASFYASRLAVKEAVYKAVAHLTLSKSLDLRIVETRNHSDGAPYIYINDQMQKVMEEAGLSKILVSITDENDYAFAFVIVE